MEKGYRYIFWDGMQRSPMCVIDIGSIDCGCSNNTNDVLCIGGAVVSLGDK